MSDASGAAAVGAHRAVTADDGPNAPTSSVTATAEPDTRSEPDTRPEPLRGSEADSAPGATDTVGSAERVPLPLWFEIGLLFVVLAVVCCGGLGLALAVADHYSFGLSVGVGGAVAVVATGVGAWALTRRGTAWRHRGAGTLPALAAVAFVVAQTLWNAVHAGDWLFLDRDPAAYAVAAKFLTNHTGLVDHYGRDWAGTAFALRGGGAGIYEIPGNSVEFQFNHLLAVLLAQIGHVGGDRALLDGNALLTGLGLLAVYAAGVRLTGRPWTAFTAVVALGVSLPLVYVARSAFSEGVTMLLVWAGAWLLLTAWERAPFVLGLFGGAAVGTAVAARVDALVYVLPLPVVAAAVALVVARDPARWRRILVLSSAAVLGGAAPVVVGTIDVEHRAGSYYHDLAAQIRPLHLLTVVALVAGFAVVLLAPLARPVLVPVAAWLRPRRSAVAVGVAVGVVVLVVVAWSLRPAFDHPLSVPNPTVAAAQLHEGVDAPSTRTYAERSVVWLSWYLGAPLLLLAAVGSGVAVRRLVRGVPAAVAILGVTAPSAVLYLYRLSNTPDQVFGVRRFVPATLPLFALTGAVAVAVLAARLPGLLGPARRRFAAPVTALLAVAVLAFPVGTTWQVADFSPRQGLLATLDDVCHALGPDASVLFPIRSQGSLTYLTTLRTFCGIPVATPEVSPTLDQLRVEADTLAARGRRLWIVDSVPTSIANLVGAASVQTLGVTVNDHELAATLTRAPDQYVTWSRGWYGAPVPR